MDSDEEFQHSLDAAQEFLERHLLDEAIQSATNALLIAGSTDEIIRARIVLIQGHFGLNHFDQVCDIVDDMSSAPIPQSLDHIALMIGLSCLGAVHKYQRTRTIKVLTNSAESVCRLFFDSELGFSNLRNVATEITDCNYGSALGKLRGMTFDIGDLALIVDNLTLNLLVEYVTSYSRVTVDQIAKEFEMSAEEVLQKTEDLIRNHPRLTEYRIDARDMEVHRRFRTNEERLAHLNWERQRQSREIVDEITLFNWRLITATGQWVVGKDVSP